MASSIAWGRRTTSEQVCAYFSSSIRGRNIIVTGPTITGVGYATANAIAEQGPAVLVLAGRSLSKLEEAQRNILGNTRDAKIRLLQVDLSDMTSVRKAAAEVNGWNMPIDVLINNAAVMDTPYTLTSEGHELQFATNYLGHWLFTNTLLPRILQGRNKRIVNVSSSGHVSSDIRYDDPNFKKAYGQSKTACCLMATSLARKHGSEGLGAFSLDPGGISTPLQQHWSLEEKQEIGRKYGAYKDDGTVDTSSDIWKTPSQGGAGTCRAAFDPDIITQNGAYLVDAQVANDKRKEYAGNEDNAEKLWKFTNELLGEEF
ncbi:short-chain dehydrogenase [Naematelia encephala]|uniref:Short-chain dehydrogenase n=1 Tax=Naematelia encephala TaxID=71784 RepID=A0A1Y2B967_9TREE|nr:short-chain dehydrogenase [Naematelia encephala]